VQGFGGLRSVCWSLVCIVPSAGVLRAERCVLGSAQACAGVLKGHGRMSMCEVVGAGAVPRQCAGGEQGFSVVEACAWRHVRGGVSWRHVRGGAAARTGVAQGHVWGCAGVVQGVMSLGLQ
jgi:hypothetical protein